MIPTVRSIPIRLGGAPRGLALLNGTLAAAVGIGLQLWLPGLTLWLVGHALSVWVAKRDPSFLEVARRHVRYPAHLGA